MGPCRQCKDWQLWSNEEENMPVAKPTPKKNRFNPRYALTSKQREMSMLVQIPVAPASVPESDTATPSPQRGAATANAKPDAATYFDQQREVEHEYRYGSDASAYHRLFENAPALPELFDALEYARSEHPDFVPTPMAALAILLEEVGEVAKAVNEEDATAQREELLQCGAVILRWLSDDMSTTTAR